MNLKWFQKSYSIVEQIWMVLVKNGKEVLSAVSNHRTCLYDDLRDALEVLHVAHVIYCGVHQYRIGEGHICFNLCIIGSWLICTVLNQLQSHCMASFHLKDPKRKEPAFQGFPPQSMCSGRFTNKIQGRREIIFYFMKISDVQRRDWEYCTETSACAEEPGTCSLDP